MPILPMVIFLLSIKSAESGEQFFLVVPERTEASVGERVVLHCQVGNRAGEVQWSKDGFLLGFEPHIPGFPRYSMDVKGNQGIYNLIITDVRLSDEGEFQCQVGPAPEQHPIRSGAKLIVILPPAYATMTSHPTIREIQVREGTRLSLSCELGPSKPPSTLHWFKNAQEIHSDYDSTEVPNTDSNCGLCSLTRSTMVLHPRREDNGAAYRCLAQHPALRQPLEASITIQVLHPPEPPSIEGYQTDDSVRVGDVLSLVCISRTGNPPARLAWFRGNVRVDASDTINGLVTSNTYSWTVRARDNKSILRCEASNDVSTHPVETSVQLNVIYPPESVRVNGPRSAVAGDTVSFACTTAASNPPALITWSVDNGSVFLPGDELSYGTDSGWVTTSNLTVTLTGQEPEVKSFRCKAETPPFPAIATKTAKMIVYSPPKPPTILGHSLGQVLHEGDLYRFVCVALGGNPRANLRWYKAEREIRTLTSTSGSGISSELVIRAESDDNGATYRCEAENIATSRPFAAFLKLFVYYGPKNVTVTADPQPVKAGKTVRLICRSGPSNPRAVLGWRRGQETLTGTREDSLPSTYGGVTTHSVLTVRLVASDDGTVISCLAKNEALGRTVTKNITLRVLFKPEFTSPLTRVDVVERETTLVNASALANPIEVVYRWSRRGIPVPSARDKKRFDDGVRDLTSVEAEGPVLYITHAGRKDAGSYVLEAANSEGASNATFILNVLYGSVIRNYTRNAEAKEGGSVKLECLVDANPTSTNVVSWRRKSTGQMLPSVSTSNVHSELLLKNVTRADAGLYECVAYNSIGRQAVAESQMVVTYKPVVLPGMSSRIVGGQVSGEVSMRCQAEASPSAVFTWYFAGTPVDSVHHQGKFLVRNMRTEERIWGSLLYVRDLKEEDFGNYTCLCKNDLGQDTIEIILVKQRKPDVPKNLRVENATETEAWLSWEPGFDGGLTQTFLVRYSKEGESNYVYEKVANGKAECKVSGLEAGAKYHFSVAAANALGESAFCRHVLQETLKGSSSNPKSSVDSKNKSSGATPRHYWWVTTVVVGGILVFLNLTVIICLVSRKRQRIRKKAVARRAAHERTCHSHQQSDGMVGLLMAHPTPFTTAASKTEEIQLHHFDFTGQDGTDTLSNRGMIKEKTLKRSRGEGKTWPDIISSKYLGPSGITLKPVVSFPMEELMPVLEEDLACVKTFATPEKDSAICREKTGADDITA